MKAPDSATMSRIYKGPSSNAGVFIPSNISPLASCSSSSPNPQNPRPASQAPGPPSFQPIVDWSYGDTEGYRRTLGRHFYSLSEPNKDKRPLSGAPLGSRDRSSLPRRHAQRSMPDDLRSRGSPLRPTEEKGIKSSTNTRAHSTGESGGGSQYNCPDIRSEEGPTVVPKQNSRPNQHLNVRSTGFSNCNNDPIPFHIPAFADRLKAHGGSFPVGPPNQLSHTAHAQQLLPMYNQTRPFDPYEQSSRHGMIFHDNNSLDQPSAFVFPSHSLSSNQPFHKAQGTLQVENNDDITQSNYFEPYAPGTPTPAHPPPQPQVNPYAQDANGLAGSTYYQSSNSYAQQQVNTWIVTPVAFLLI